MIIKIDTEKWITQKQLAKEKKVSKQVINNWITRKKLKTLEVPQLGIKLVEKTKPIKKTT